MSVCVVYVHIYTHGTLLHVMHMRRRIHAYEEEDTCGGTRAYVMHVCMCMFVCGMYIYTHTGDLPYLLTSCSRTPAICMYVFMCMYVCVMYIYTHTGDLPYLLTSCGGILPYVCNTYAYEEEDTCI
jgi:hypothetical protein